MQTGETLLAQEGGVDMLYQQGPDTSLVWSGQSFLDLSAVPSVVRG